MTRKGTRTYPPKGRTDRNDVRRRLALPVLLTMYLLSGVITSCTDEGPRENTDDGLKMALQVSILDIGSRSEDLSPIEKIHDLRVIVTRREADREILEYNRLIDLSNPEGEIKYGYTEDPRLMFRMEKAGKHHLYLFANCEPILEAALQFVSGVEKHPDPEDGVYNAGMYREDIDQYTVDAYLGALQEATYTNDLLQTLVATGADGKVNGLPMSAEHDVDITSTGSYGTSETVIINKPIVRACNKITFEYVNMKPEYPIFIRDWTLQNVAETAYLLPHVDEGENSELLAGSDGWIDWYEKHINTYGSDAPHGEELVFEVPENVNYNPYKCDYNDKSGMADGETVPVTGLKVEGFDLNQPEKGGGKATDEKVYYFPETCYIPQNSDRQEYSLQFNTKEHAATSTSVDGTTTWYSANGNYDSGILDRVTTLFRGTHVKIKATFMEGDKKDIDVSIINWTVKDYGSGNLVPETKGTE